MTKLDLALINQPGNVRPVPKEMDRHMVKYIVGERKKAIESDPNLIQKDPWDHSDVFYAVRTWLNQHGWDTSVYNDNVAGGADRRKALYDMIKTVCEDTYHVKRHQIGIFPDERAIMAYGGRMLAVGFESLKTLMTKGTDIFVVEKAGTVMKMVPFTSKVGIAFIQSQGFVSEYGIALAALCNQSSDVARDYTNSIPRYVGHLGVLTDCDHSGVLIGFKIPGATRLGIDLNAINEINEANPGLGLELETLEEGTKPNHHWTGLYNIAYPSSNGHARKSNINLTPTAKKICREYLLQHVTDSEGNEIEFIEYLKHKRIELNTIMSEIGPEAFWNWLRYKILKLWPRRDYRRVFNVTAMDIRTPTMLEFDKWLIDKIEPIMKPHAQEIEDELSDFEGLIEDVEGKEEEIESDIQENTLLTNEQIQKIDLALEEIMKDKVR